MSSLKLKIENTLSGIEHDVDTELRMFDQRSWGGTFGDDGHESSSTSLR